MKAIVEIKNSDLNQHTENLLLNQLLETIEDFGIEKENIYITTEEDREEFERMATNLVKVMFALARIDDRIENDDVIEFLTRYK